MEAVIHDISKAISPEPETYTKPKALCEIFGSSCLKYIFDIISSAKIKKAYVYLDENSEECETRFGKSAGGIDLEWNFKCADIRPRFDIGKDGLLLFCGIKFYDANLQSAIDYHKTHGADLTVLTLPPENGKQLWNFKDTAHLYVPSGIYIMSQKCCDFLKTEGTFSISEELVKNVSLHGMKVSFYDNSVYANPLSDISDYLRCHMDILDEKARFSAAFHRILSDSSISKSDNDAYIEQPSSVGSNVTFGKGASVSRCVIGDNVFIGEGASVNSSVILSGAHIAANTRCEGAVICRGASLLCGSTICKGAAVGAGAIIGKGARVEENVRVYPKKHLGDYKTASFDVRNHEISLEFDDDASIGGETGTEISPMSAVKIGRSLAKHGNIIVTGHSGTSCARALEAALSSGALSCGADVWATGECLVSELFYAMKTLGADYGFFVQSDSYTKISVYSKNCTELSATEQSTAESAIRYDNAPKMNAAHFGTLHDFSAAKELYIKKLCAKQPEFPITLSTSNNRCSQIVNSLGIDSLGSKITFRISCDGTKASAFSAQTGFVSYEKLTMICVSQMLDDGDVPKLPSDFPKSVQLIFSDHNTPLCIHPHECESFFKDGFELVLTVCDFLSKNAITLEQAVAALPSFAVAQRVVGLSAPLSSALTQLESFCSKHPDITIKPTKSGKTLIMRAESTEYETANELCDICQRIAQGHAENYGGIGF